MKKILLLIVVFLIIVSGAKVLTLHAPLKERNVEVVPAILGGVELSLEIAKTPQGRANGLSGRESLEEGQGLLFVFPKEGKYSFWMKDMNFPIDIIWIDKNMRVVGVLEEARPDSYPGTFSPPSDIQFVLEVPAGFYKRHSVKVGEGLFLKSQNDVLEGVF